MQFCVQAGGICTQRHPAVYAQMSTRTADFLQAFAAGFFEYFPPAAPTPLCLVCFSRSGFQSAVLSVCLRLLRFSGSASQPDKIRACFSRPTFPHHVLPLFYPPHLSPRPLWEPLRVSACVRACMCMRVLP